MRDSGVGRHWKKHLEPDGGTVPVLSLDHRKTHDLPVLWLANTSPLEILASGNLSRDCGAPLIGADCLRHLTLKRRSQSTSTHPDQNQ